MGHEEMEAGMAYRGARRHERARVHTPPVTGTVLSPPAGAATRARRAAARDATLVIALLLAAIYAGSGGLAHFDHALGGYCVATLVAGWLGAREVASFWRRRPAALFGRALLAALAQPRRIAGVLRAGSRSLGGQRFIARRSVARWLGHLLVSWGTLAAFAITLPLVWGWLHFEPAGAYAYRAVLVGVPVLRFATGGAVGWLVFHALVLSAVAVVLGTTCFIATRVRRAREAEAATGFHLWPLLLLLAVGLTGLALPLAGQMGPHWLSRAAAAGHEAAVVLLLVALPYGKLIHLFIRPLHIGVQLVRVCSREAARCRSCSGVMAPAVQLEAVETVLAERGFRFHGHQRLCPSCRRRRLAAVHVQIFGACFQPNPTRKRVVVPEAA